MRFTLKQAAVTTSTILALSLVSAGAFAATEITHFSYSGHGATWKTYLDTMAERFTKETGIKVNIVVSAGSGDYQPKLAVMIAGNSAPDVTDGHPVINSPFIKDDVFEDLRPYIKRDKIPTDQIPPSAMLGTATPDGKQWGIPVSIYPVVTGFNVDLFAQMGLQNPRQLGNNWTWETMAQAGRRFTADINGDGTVDRYGTSRIQARWEAQVHQAGGMAYDRMTLPTKDLFNTDPVRTAIDYIYNMLIVDKSATMSYSKYDMQFENVGFNVTDGPGSALISASYDITLPPKGPANRASRVNPDGFQILKASKNKEAAWQWVKFLVSTPENQSEMAKITGKLPSLKEAMLKWPKYMPKLPQNWYAFIETAFSPDGYPGYVVANAKAIDPIVNNNLAKVWNGSVAPEAALQLIHEQVSAVFAQ